MSYLFRDQSWPQLEEYLKKPTLLILPIGTTEEHGKHMPVDTDARIAEAYGTRLAEALVPEMPVLLMDTIRYGYSMQIMRQWPGTIVVRSRVFMDMIFDICRSVLDMGFKKLVLLDCHGHHSGPLNTVSRELGDACGTGFPSSAPQRCHGMNSPRFASPFRVGLSTRANGKLRWCCTWIPASWICRRQPMKTSCVITPSSSPETALWAGNA